MTFLILVEMLQSAAEYPLSSWPQCSSCLGASYSLLGSSRSHMSSSADLGWAGLNMDRSLHPMSTLSSLSNCELHSTTGILFPIIQDTAPASHTSKLVVT